MIAFRHLIPMMLSAFASLLYAAEPLVYRVNLLDRSGDTFKVEFLTEGLSEDQALFQFAATAPGTYQVMDIGRYVRSFTALDAGREPLPVRQEGRNSWRLLEPTKVRAIVYTIAETWDTPVVEHEIYPMAGTSLEDDHVLINGQAVFGFPRGLQQRPVRVYLDYPATWRIGTALRRQADGAFAAENFDQLVDSPMLLGRLTSASKRVGHCDVDLFVYSKRDLAKAEDLLERLDDVIDATAAFLGGFPVDNYTFLYHFDDFSAGGWEHNYSSFYVASEHDLAKVLDSFLCRTAAHEIFHMVTPLHIHSDRIVPFDFQEPKPSAHVWFYEGVTEWAAGMMRLRAGQLSLEEYLGILTEKLRIAERKDSAFSLEQIGRESYTAKGQIEWENVYHRGAVVAGLLDILLLRLSDGKRGLRDVVLELAAIYGPKRAFPEERFFALFAERTAPEVAVFLDHYVRDTKPLPLAEYYSWLGIDYQASLTSPVREPAPGFHLKVSSARRIVADRVSPELERLGLREGDEVLRFSGISVTGANLAEVNELIAAMAVDTCFELELRRRGETRVIQGQVGEQFAVRSHLFSLEAGAAEPQLKLRQHWLSNQPPARELIDAARLQVEGAAGGQGF